MLRRGLVALKCNDEVIARWVSHVVSPHIVGIILTITISLRFSDNLLEVLFWLAIVIPLVIVPPLAYLIWLVRKGKLEDIYMPRRESRILPLTMMLGWLLVCWGLLRYWTAPQVVEAFVLGTIVLLGILSIVTLFWKISFHGATISAAATALVMLAGSYALPVMLLIPLVGWSRIRLERHTPRQVIYGSFVGILLALLLVQGLLSKTV